MSLNSKIEWTNATWNPVIGCSKISEGCNHCYAERMMNRFKRVPGHPFEGGFRVRCLHSKLDLPLHWKKPKRIFVNSMSDLFHEDVPGDFIYRVCEIMAKARWHRYQVLTKRPIHMYYFFEKRDSVGDQPNRIFSQFPHIWWGVSVENEEWTIRIKALQECPVKNKFISFEPLLGDVGNLNLDGIGWVIVGGETGRGAREMKPEWALNILDQCKAKNIPFFFKQWGGKMGKFPVLDRRIYHEMPDSLNLTHRIV